MAAYLRSPDPVSDFFILSERNFQDYCLIRKGTELDRRVFESVEFQREILRSATCQKIAYRGGTVLEYARLCIAFNRLGVPFPSLGMAQNVLQQVGNLQQYHLEDDGPKWHIRVNYAPDFERAYADEEWRLTTAAGVATIPVQFSELSRALKALSHLNGTDTTLRLEALSAESATAQSMMSLLSHQGWIDDCPPDAPDLTELPEFMFLGHSGIFARGRRGAIVIDPCIASFADSHSTRNPYRIINAVDAVLITHNHWDHMPPGTLLRIRRDMTMYVPRVQSKSFSNPPIRAYLEAFGFVDVREVSPGEVVAVDDVRVFFFPFFGEPFGCNSRFDGFTYYVDIGGFSFFGSVDACSNEIGNMDEVISSVGRMLRPDLFLFGATNQCHNNGYAASGPRYLSNELQSFPELMRYHPSLVEVERWIGMLRPRLAMPFAHFVLEGRCRRDVTIPDVVTGKVNVLDDYWQDFVPSQWTPKYVATWRNQLKYLHGIEDTKVIMLHPMQGLRV